MALDPVYQTDALARDLEPAIDLTDAPIADAGTKQQNILDPGFELTLRPMRYPQFFEICLLYTSPSPRDRG